MDGDLFRRAIKGRRAVRPGDRVRILFGSLADCVATVVALSNRHRCILRLDELDHRIRVILPADEVERSI